MPRHTTCLIFSALLFIAAETAPESPAPQPGSPAGSAQGGALLKDADPPSKPDTRSAGFEGPDKLPKEWNDSWFGSTEKGQAPRFKRHDATRVTWVREVATSTMAACEEALKEKSFLPFDLVESRPGSYYRVSGAPLTMEKLLGGDKETPPPGTKPYLVRAVYVHPLTGGFWVYLEEGNLLVSHHCLGPGWARVKRTALVVALPSEPKTVTVRCGVAR